MCRLGIDQMIPATGPYSGCGLLRLTVKVVQGRVHPAPRIQPPTPNNSRNRQFNIGRWNRRQRVA